MKLEDLKGRKIRRVEVNYRVNEIIFYLEGYARLKMYHAQECCENVYIADICGDLSDLEDATIVHFEKRTVCVDMYDLYDESGTATFYDIQTNKGCVNIRWKGESNGFYSEGVSIIYKEELIY